MDSQAILKFGDYRLDPVSGRLYQHGVPVPLTPKAFALLHSLAAGAGRLFSKQELLDAVWPGVFVGDAVLKTTIRELRKALNDDSHEPRFIETAHRRGYRFLAPVTTESPVPAVSHGVPHPRVGYAHSGKVNIAYQVIGSGPVDLVFAMGWVSHLDCYWNQPLFARFLERLASMSRLILFDKRGTGLSDPVPVSELPTLEQRMDDVRAVMDAVGSTRAVLLGVSEGGPMCSLFAATHPEKTHALVMLGSYARRLKDVDYPWGTTEEERDRFCEAIVEDWGGPVGIEERAPSMASDPAFRDWWAGYLRMGASPGAAVALTRMNAAIDIRDVLPTIRVPTLVIHRTGDRCLGVEQGRYLASQIPGATLLELSGSDHLPFVGNQDEIVDAIAAFLHRLDEPAAAQRVLASVLTVKPGPGVRSVPEQVAAAFEDEVVRWRGRTLVAAADRLIATFDGPARAVHCGVGVVSRAADHGALLRAGVHIGECELASASGPILDMSAAMANAAGPGEVYVSRTVVDLVAGSGLAFDERGLLRIGGLQRAMLAVREVADPEAIGV